MSDRTLIVCYSHTGPSRRVADLLAGQFQLQVFGNAVRENAKKDAAVRPTTLSPSAV